MVKENTVLFQGVLRRVKRGGGGAPAHFITVGRGAVTTQPSTNKVAGLEGASGPQPVSGGPAPTCSPSDSPHPCPRCRICHSALWVERPAPSGVHTVTATPWAMCVPGGSVLLNQKTQGSGFVPGLPSVQLWVKL